MAHPDPTELERVQRWMQSVIMHPDGVVAGIASPAARTEIDIAPGEVETVICPSQKLTSIERLHVYANAYYARLLEVLAAEFPAVAEAVGDEVFQGFAFGYLQQHPSLSYTLADLGTHFAEYLARTRPPRESDGVEPDWADFLVDLAQVERLYSEVFDGPGVEGECLLQAADLHGITPAAWLTARLIPVPCLRLVRLRFPIHEYITAVRRKEHLEIPDPLPTWLVITRREFVVRRVAVNEPEFGALSVLVQGGSIAESLAAAEALWTGHEEGLADEVRRWFRDWSAAGYFLSIHNS